MGNNPLNRIDPTGKFIFLIVPAAEYVAEYAIADLAASVALGQAASNALNNIYHSEQGNATGETPELPTDLVGDNPRSSSGQRVNTDLPADDFPGAVDDLTGGNTTDPGGQQVCPNGVRVRPGKTGQGPRIDIPANGAKPPETIHFPPGTPWPW